MIALLSGIHIPSCAFADGTNVEDTDFLLKSLQEEEEAQWREIEDKHKQQNKE